MDVQYLSWECSDIAAVIHDQQNWRSRDHYNSLPLCSW